MGLIEGVFDGRLDGDVVGVIVGLVEGVFDGRLDGD